MSLPHALLGLISYRPATGYELKTRFNTSVHFFWNATLPQIYRTLGQMQVSGWVDSTIEHQEGKPSRRVYKVTEAGKKELRRWLAEPPEIPAPREPMMVKVFLGRKTGAAILRKQVEEWRSYHAVLLEKYTNQVAAVIDEYAALPAVAPDAPYWRITLDYGVKKAKAAIEWCDEVLLWLEKHGKGKDTG